MYFSKNLCLTLMITAVATQAYSKDQARDGARKINDEYQLYVNSLSVSEDPDLLLAKEMCGFQIFTEWGQQYMSIIKGTPNLDITDIQPVTDLVVRLQKIEVGFNEAQNIFGDHYNQFRSALTNLRTKGSMLAEASQQNISLADPHSTDLKTAFGQCHLNPFITDAVYHTNDAYWTQTTAYTSIKPGTTGVTWGIGAGGKPTYAINPGEFMTSYIKRSSYLRKAMSL